MKTRQPPSQCCNLLTQAFLLSGLRMGNSFLDFEYINTPEQ